MSSALAVDLRALGAAVAGETGATVDIGTTRTVAKLTLRVVAVSGTLGVTIQTSDDATNWRTARATNAATIQALALTLAGLSRYIRVVTTLTGGGSATWGLTGVAHTIYAEPADIAVYAVPAESIADIAQADQIDACLASSSAADSYLASAFTLPMVSWGTHLRELVAKLAAASLFRRRGADPNGPDKIVFDTESAAIKTLERFANGRLSPPDMVDSTADIEEGGSVVVSGTSRGW